MRKILIIILIVLLVGSVIVEAQQTSSSGITVTRRVEPGTQPAAAAKPGVKPPTQYNYVAERDISKDEPVVVTTGGIRYYEYKFDTDIRKGDTIASPDALDTKVLQQIPPEVKKETDKNREYTYTSETNTFVWSKDKPKDEYIIETKTDLKVSDDGESTTRETTQSVYDKTPEKEKGEYVEGSKRTEIKETKTASKTDPKTGKTTERQVIANEGRRLYDKQGNEIGILWTGYSASEKNPLVSEKTSLTFVGKDGHTYYYATRDPDGNQVIMVNELDKMKEAGFTDEQINQARVDIVASGVIGFLDSLKVLTWQQSLGRFMRAYYEFAGLRQLSSLLWPSYDAEVQARKAEIQQKFCITAGITNCAISKICGTIYPIGADNVLAGRGPGGKFVSSASLNAERSIPIEVEGMTRQQMIDLFGNATVIKGVLVNLTDPAFDPRVLGRMKLRLYHVQYSVTNNAEDEKELKYNLHFRRVGEQLNSSYGKPVYQSRWWTDNAPTLSYLATARDHIYKFSATEYDNVCLEFDPKLPSGHAAFSDMVDELCVPFIEYAGGPTEITPGAQAAAGTQPAPGAPVSSVPGAAV